MTATTAPVKSLDSLREGAVEVRVTRNRKSKAAPTQAMIMRTLFSTIVHPLGRESRKLTSLSNACPASHQSFLLLPSSFQLAAVIQFLHSAGPVMSSCLCKYGEGAGFPFQVESLEDGVDDAIHALDVHKAHHGPGAPPYFHEAALDHIGRPELAPQVAGKGEEGKQLGQVALQSPHHAAVVLPPAGAEATKGGFGVPTTCGQVDGLRPGLDFVVVGLAHFLQNIAHLVHPAALMPGSRIHRRDGCRQTRTAVGD